MLSCPSAVLLAQLGTDLLRGETFATLEGHIDGCPVCQSKLEQLARNDDAGRDQTAPSLPFQDQPPEVPGFEIECELGRGGMGVVYQAFERSLGRRVALKVVRSGPSSGSHDQARWLREARSFARVRHENVVRLYQVGEAGGWLYMVLELVPGGTLEQRLKVPYAPRDAAMLLETIAKAVIAIHREGLVHLDLKPSNILLDAGPDTPRELAVPRVGDFGIAFRSDEPDASLATALLAGPVGTPSYMAPEQVAVDREKLGPSADVYGLGAILYHLLTGHRPFAAAHVIDILDQVRNKEPVSPRRLNPTIPRDLETICLRCLQKVPGRRYSSAEALAGDLRRWLDGRTILARPVSRAEKTWRGCRRRPAVAALAVALMFTLSAGFLGMVLLWRHAEVQRIRAEADFQVANEVLEQIVDLSTGGQSGLTRALAPERLIEMLAQIRRRLRELAARRNDYQALLRQLSFVDRNLCETLMQEGRWDEARSLLEESVADLDAVLRRNPDDHYALTVLSSCLLRFSAVAGQQGRTDEGVMLLRRAVRSAEHRARLAPGVDSIDALARNREALALSLAKQGDLDESWSLMRANRLIFDGFPAGCENPRIVAWRIHVQSDFTRLIEGASSVPSAMSGDGDRARHDPLSRLVSPEANRLPAEVWAELAVEVFDPATHTGTASSMAEVFHPYLCELLSKTASELRRLGRLDEARRVADRLMAFAGRLAARYPNEPDANLALGEAYMQRSKNSWQIKDRAAIERNLKLAIDATQHALALDPNHEVARSQAAQRQRRLKDLLQSKRAANTPDQIGHPASRVGS